MTIHTAVHHTGGFLCALIFMWLCSSPVSAFPSGSPAALPFLEPSELRVIRASYPDISIRSSYEDEIGDWRIEVIRTDGADKVVTVLYWAGGRLLPESETAHKDAYQPVMYKYGKKVPDPAYFTEDYIEEIRQYTDTQSRQNQADTSLFFFDAVYDSGTRRSVEQHITTIRFLGKKTNVHERIVPALNRVETRIMNLARSSTEVKDFVDSITSIGGYNWREIGDRSSRSFHSLGIAVDILPKGWGKKNVYWAWRRDIDPENWMKLPLERRWMPPDQVIRIFESEGFIWGGKWMVWDDMHFEYHPELIRYNHISE